MMLLTFLPCWFIWLAAQKWLPAQYTLPPAAMTLLCAILAILTIVIPNLQLDAGGFGVPILTLVLSVAWALLLLLGNVVWRKVSRNT